MENTIVPQTIYTFVGDRAPSVNFIIQRANSVQGQPPTVVDLTGCTVNFFIQNPQTGARTNSSTADCTITSPTTGSITYAWGAGDLPVEGIYNAQIKIIWSSTKPETAAVSIEVAASV